MGAGPTAWAIGDKKTKGHNHDREMRYMPPAIR
jgi:hypothetical protein